VPSPPNHELKLSNFKVLFLFQVLSQYGAELKADIVISAHLQKLYDNLLEQNLIRVIEPFSKVQVTN